MDEKNKNILKTGKEEASMEFTANVMQRIKLEEKAMANVLSRDGRMAPSEDFALNLMNKLESKVPSPLYKSVISLRAWIAIAVAFVGIVVLTFFMEGESMYNIDLSAKVHEAYKGIGSFFASAQHLMYLLIGIFGVSFMLLLDQKVSQPKEL